VILDCLKAGLYGLTVKPIGTFAASFGTAQLDWNDTMSLFARTLDLVWT
jgi:hypothetical protein